MRSPPSTTSLSRERLSTYLQLLIMYVVVGWTMVFLEPPKVPGVWIGPLLVPVVGYLWAIRGAQLAIPDEPCLRSGSVPGGHWFEFASQPGRRRWLRSTAQAEAIRSHPSTPPEMDGHTLRIVQPSMRHHQHLWSANVNFAAITSALVLTVFLLTPAYGALKNGGAATALFHDVGSNVMCGALMVVLYGGLALLLQWLPTTVGLGLWQLLARHRRTQAVELHGTVLRADGRSFYLNHDVVPVLSHDTFGAVLELTGPEDRITLRGDHAPLHWLHDHVAARRRPLDAIQGPERAAQRLRQAVREREP